MEMERHRCDEGGGFGSCENDLSPWDVYTADQDYLLFPPTSSLTDLNEHPDGNLGPGAPLQGHARLSTGSEAYHHQRLTHHHHHPQQPSILSPEWDYHMSSDIGIPSASQFGGNYYGYRPYWGPYNLWPNFHAPNLRRRYLFGMGGPYYLGPEYQERYGYGSRRFRHSKPLL